MSKQPDGIYSAFMTGAQGQGFAMYVFDRGVITGADPLGVLFDGKYTVDDGDGIIKGSVTVTVPPGGTVIQGVTAGPSGMTYEVPISITLEFEKVDYLRLETPLGPVNLKLKLLRSLEHS